MSPSIVGRAWLAEACDQIARAVAAGEGELALELHAYVRERVRATERGFRLCSIHGCHRRTMSRRCTAHTPGMGGKAGHWGGVR